MNKNIRINPVAYLNDLSGVNFVLEINKGGKKSYAMVIPPDYKIISERDESLLVSAVVNHYFIPYDGKVYSEEYVEKIKMLAEKLSKK